MKDSYFYNIWLSFKKTYAGFLPGLLGAISWFIPDISLIYRILIFIIIVIIGIMIALFDAGMKVFYRTHEIAVVHIIDNKKESILLLLRCGNIFPIGTLIDVYVSREGFEEYIGFGEVINIQNNLLTQVKILQTNGENCVYTNEKSNLIIKVHDKSKSSKSSE